MKISQILAWPFIKFNKLMVDIMDFIKDLLNKNSTVSSMRFWRLLILLNITLEWQHAVWLGAGIWFPSTYVLAFAAGVLGISMFQKGMELMNTGESKK